MQRFLFSCFALGLALTSSFATAHAQPAPAGAPADAPSAAPAAAPADPTPVAQPAPEPVAAPAPEAPGCFPACRAGYLCSAGQCISACNPACGPGESCTADGQCELVTPAPAAAPAAPPAAPSETKRADDGDDDYTHDGFMLRVTLGFAGGAMNEDYDGVYRETGVGVRSGSAEYAGGGFAGSIDIGGGLSDNLTLHGRLGFINFTEPNRTVDGADYGRYEDRQLTSFILGPGLTYTFMPANIYLTGVVGIGGTAVGDTDDDDDDDDATGTDDEIDETGDNEVGLALNLDVGKEWWLSPRVGVGAALRFWFASSHFEDAFYEADRRTLALALLFSLTYQ